ncbi:phosphoribosyltransferase [bacterium]|nr:MAG: phosphoribosyltransferase [bacterium]
MISYSDEPFSGRVEAAKLLAGELTKFRAKNAVVLGIPRGGVVIAKEIAFALDARLDIVLTHKLGAPGNPELAIGAITEDGKIFLNEMLAGRLDAESVYLKQEKGRQLAVIKRRVEQYRKILAKVPLKDSITIITDDGVATGATMKAALWAARREHPKMLIAALPVGPQDTVRELSQDADEVVCLRSPSFFGAIGQFYLDFSQVEDEEVLEILKKEAERGK